MDFTKAPILMGIVNVTPDSFSDGGRFLDPEKAVEQGLQLEKEGAHILDIGGESTRPGAEPVSVEEECARVVPVLKGLKNKGCQALLSIDTRHAEVMATAIEAGVDMINDISALTYDSESVAVIARSGLPVCLMHMKGTPKTMQDNPVYEDVVQEVFEYLKERIAVCLAAGVTQDKIICDPGIGFGKTLADNIKLLKNIEKFQELGCAVMIGASRKSFIDTLCVDVPVDKRLPGSLAASLWSYQQGVQLFRVHDVAETKQALEVYAQML